MGSKQLTIDNLLLDTDNPRISGAENQRDALQKILDDQKEKLYALAEHIVDNGMSPIERLLVLKENKTSKKYIVLEGNRRIVALKFLNNPHVLASLELKSALQKRFDILSANFDRSAVEPIDCFEVADREEAAQWILLRHTGENDGRGVAAWSGLVTSRFRGNDPALQALEFVKAYGELSDSDKALLENIRFPITTLERLIATPDVRKRIGVEVKKKKLMTRLSADELMKPLRRIVLDLARKNINVTQLKLKDQQIQYIDRFDKKSKPDLSSLGPSKTVEKIKEDDFAAKKGTKKAKRGYPDPASRRKLVPRKANVNVTDNRVARIYKELKSLKLADHPNALAVLLRVFLELSVDHYLEENGIPLTIPGKGKNSVDKKLTKKVGETIDHLVSAKGCNRKDFLGVTRGLSDNKSPLYIGLLHAYVHNRFVSPKPHDLTGAWDNAQRYFESLWS